jgi:hypothetical protein
MSEKTKREFNTYTVHGGAPCLALPHYMYLGVIQHKGVLTTT